MHSLDYVVMLQVMFNLASGVEATPMTVWKQLQDRGIRSAKNAKELVGKNAVYESFARLVAAGYLRRQQLPHPKLPGRKGPVVYQMYDNPAWNPDWQQSEADITEDHRSVNPQVGTLPGTPDPEFRKAGETAGRNASRNAGRVNAGSGVPGSVNRIVPAGQNASPVPGSGMASPPHPPEEVTTSSPSPLTDTSGRTSLPSPREEEEEEAGYAQEDLQASAEVLQLLPDPWTQGKVRAGKLAPRLLAVMAEQGWPDIHSVDRHVLIKQLTKNPEKIKNHSSLLARDRIPNLPRYAVVAAPVSSGSSSDPDARCPKHPQYRAGIRCVPCMTA
ncbi:hypothetical protein ACIBKX_40280 [Streptomyces sp. NPDC050658]|uniref:hypothetical protein n=1 Tax=unclassified Streptomyces TaxID=2593676 RepID=UPI00342609C9